MSDEGVCRTAPATPGLLNKLSPDVQDLKKFNKTYLFNIFQRERIVPTNILCG